jgi:hypothetical protein
MTVSLNIVAALVAIWNLLTCNFGAGPDVAAVILIGVVVFGLLFGPYFLFSTFLVSSRTSPKSCSFDRLICFSDNDRGRFLIRTNN